MRNVWKGLVVGGLTGVAAGVALDLANRGSQLGGAAAKRAVDLAPKAADRIRAAATTGAARVQDAATTGAGRLQDAVQDSDARDHVRDQVKEIAHRLSDADVTDQAREKLHQATKKGAELAHSVRNAAPGGAPTG
jgi:predicted nucleic acid-binding OB-fold protein